MDRREFLAGGLGDFLPDRAVRFFKWDVKTQAPDAIDDLPFHVAETRPASLTSISLPGV